MSPLKKGKSKRVISGNVKEMVKSPSFAENKTPEKRRSMAFAAAMRKAGKSRKR